MHLAIVRSGLGLLLLAFAGCAPAPYQPPTDGGTGDGGGTVTYRNGVQTILQAKCAPCHTTGASGGHNIASSYADVHMHVESLQFGWCWGDMTTDPWSMPKTIGECAYILSMVGEMPMGLNCSGSMPMPGCVTPAELAVLAAWVAAGMPE